MRTIGKTSLFVRTVYDKFDKNKPEPGFVAIPLQVCQHEEGTTNYFALGRVDQVSFQTNGTFIQAFIQMNPSDPNARSEPLDKNVLGR